MGEERERVSRELCRQTERMHRQQVRAVLNVQEVFVLLEELGVLAVGANGR